MAGPSTPAASGNNPTVEVSVSQKPFIPPQPTAKKFWLVATAEGPLVENTKYSNKKDAEDRAMNFTNAQRKPYYVMETVECFKPKADIDRCTFED